MNILKFLGGAVIGLAGTAAALLVAYGAFRAVQSWRQAGELLRRIHES